ncbi:3-hydroxyacyl-CoA dehydrogenase NAD-binding domain-containing protein [Agrococcus beijingensis]|uniref:3-hydroxyacyl-CoA dehydrogenase NAD-binding domain-containing protein n=1 Tax=Agrococcus beijingensis TaxID=3068634 RepID=UPI002741C60F|nr:3-hydroxyacyl-CoA dehydrogenase NAD-binding domain-containing protein [Agrococcus sp. REN33]
MSVPTIVTVVGSGIMGPGIGAVLAAAGAQVRIYDISEAAVAAAETAYDKALGVVEQLSGPSGAPDAVFTTDIAVALEGTELVIEAVPERIEIKRSVLAQIEELVSDDTVVATNTSGIPISTMAETMRVPGRFVGMHWSNPPHLIPMIEVIPGAATDQAVTDRMMAIVRAIGYEPVLEKEIAGFVENRVLYAIMRECLSLVEQGIVTQEDLDTCVRWGIGYKLAVVGPMRLLDMAGLDTYRNVSSYLNAELDSSAGVPEMIERMTADGRLGMKSGDGLYEYGEGDVAATRGRITSGLLEVRKVLSGLERV